MHPAWLRCKSSEYPDISALSRLSKRAPQHLKLRTYFCANPKKKWKELEESVNPFACVVMAYLKAVETAGDNEKRYQWKVSLIKRLYRSGYKKQDVIRLFDCIGNYKIGLAIY